LGRLAGTRWAWLGDGNNVLNSIIEAAGLIGFSVEVACPERFEPDEKVVFAARERGAEIAIMRNPRSAAKDADVVVTDSWVSMGQEAGGEAKLAALEPYRVSEEIMARAQPEALFLHCLPAHRGEEVVDAVIDGAQSAVWDEAENRLHAQKAILLRCFGMIG
ncbi:MAG: ornithine carbamoyltransferase, partial [Sphingomonadales bacterium]|nr:ornithine carbamoyltransferase [Sphingomonadales bacterium]